MVSRPMQWSALFTEENEKINLLHETDETKREECERTGRGVITLRLAR